MTISPRNTEIFIRAQMESIRPEIKGLVACDLCGCAQASERHHIITKYSTMNRDEMRRLANGPLVTALLCKDCHNKADNVKERTQLLLNLYRINGRGNAQKGYEAMKPIFDKIFDLTAGILWRLPEVVDE
jgi:uncharacterized protein YlaI